MAIIKTETIEGVKTYTVKKDMSDTEADKKLMNKFVTASMINDIIIDDADVYAEEGNSRKLLLKFRKNTLSKKHTSAFYDNVIKFALTPTSNRGSATGSKSKNVYDNPRIMTNIFGYFDRFSPTQKKNFRIAGYKLPLEVRECRFNRDFPELYNKTLPLIREINALYKLHTPVYFKRQNDKAKETAFKIPNTAFTTITTNVNFRTSIHKDKGDDAEGFGNLVVIENGKYSGAETCFPQYGIGVDVRTNDMLFMNVHEMHGNLPMKQIDKDARRLSVVCYLREKLWKRTRGKNEAFVKKHNKTVRDIGGGKQTILRNKTKKRRSLK
tara:strand:- start:1262 stop:2236 length:975 start_codon:yes stop_codon:yes gene_type:complete